MRPLSRVMRMGILELRNLSFRPFEHLLCLPHIVFRGPIMLMPHHPLYLTRRRAIQGRIHLGNDA